MSEKRSAAAALLQALLHRLDARETDAANKRHRALDPDTRAVEGARLSVFSELREDVRAVLGQLTGEEPPARRYPLRTVSVTWHTTHPNVARRRIDHLRQAHRMDAATPEGLLGRALWAVECYLRSDDYSGLEEAEALVLRLAELAGLPLPGDP